MATCCHMSQGVNEGDIHPLGSLTIIAIHACRISSTAQLSEMLKEGSGFPYVFFGSTSEGFHKREAWLFKV